LDDNNARVIQDAFSDAAKNHSAEELLFDPIRNAIFVRHCKDAKLLGDARTWNEFLLQLSDQGRLREEGKHKKVSLQAIEAVSDAAEIAFQMLSVDYAMDLETILCSPDAAAQFDEIAKLFGGDDSAIVNRTAIWHLRRIATGKKIVAATKKRAAEFIDEPVPDPLSIASYLDSCPDDAVAGVFAIADPESVLFVGQSSDVAARLAEIVSNEGWNRFEPREVQVWPIADAKQALVHRCLLVSRHKPWLNAHFLHQPIATTLF
jgi:hypothetical protein